jgi:signal transduction histidine kinase
MRTKIILLLLIISTNFVKAEKFPFELKEERRFTAEAMLPVDINKDSIDELVSFTHYNIALLDQKGNFIKDYYFPLESLKVKKYLSVCDYNEDGKKELFVMSEKDLTITVDCYNPTGYQKLLKHSIGWTVPYRNKNKKWFGEIIAAKGIDVNDDGKNDVLFNLYTGGDTILRGVVVLDIETEKEIWHYWIGPQVYNIILEDLNNDNNPEIILGTYSPSNGNQSNNTVDWESYVIVLDRKGNLLWQKKIGEYFSEALIAVSDIDLDGRKEVITAGSTRRADSIPDKLWILNGFSGVEKKSVVVGEKIWGLACTDINNDENDEILTGNSDGTIRVFNPSLKQIKSYRNNNGVELISVCDLNGDGKNEIITTNESNKLIIFDGKLNQIAQTELDHTLLHRLYSISFQNIWFVKDYKQTKLLTLNPKEQQNEFILYEFYKIPFLSRRIPVVTVIIGTILLLLLFTIGMVYARYTKTRDIRFVIRGLTGKSGVIEMNQKGDIVNISPRAREILKIDEKDKKSSKISTRRSVMLVPGKMAINLFQHLKKPKGFETLNRVQGDTHTGYQSSNDLLRLLSEIKQFNPILELAKSILIDSALSSPQENAISLFQDQSYLVRCIRVKKGVLITFEDISAVEYMKRVTSWAPVAQMLAHGIKTPLMNIQLSAEQLESACEPVKDKTDKIIDGIKSETKRLRKLTDNFMRFTQLSPLNLTSENINDILKELCDKYSFSIPERIKIECDFSDELEKVMVDRKEIENAISIIVDNAVESMNPSSSSMDVASLHLRSASPTRGEEIKSHILSVKTSVAEKQEKEKIKKYVVIEISDTGKGIPEKYMNELFKPYFTYGKPEGTGLGLTLAKKIIESHNGNIEIHSKENIGTTVTLYLPV